MSTEDNKAIVRRMLHDCVTAKNIDLVDQIFAEDFVWHGFPVQGLTGIKQHIAGVFEALPDVNPVVDTQVAEGDMVATRYTVSATFAKDWFGVRATGQKGTWSGQNICRIGDGKIAEIWQIEDALSMWQQFGALSQIVGDDEA